MLPKRTELDKRNAAIRAWFVSNLAPLANEALALGIKNYTGAFYGTTKQKIYSRKGMVIGGGYQIPRHAVYVHKGVGRGYPIEAQGGLGITKSKAAEKLRDRGYNKTAIANSLATALGGKKRKRKPFFNPVIDRRLPILADEVAKWDANMVTENIFIK